MASCWIFNAISFALMKLTNLTEEEKRHNVLTEAPPWPWIVKAPSPNEIAGDDNEFRFSGWPKIASKERIDEAGAPIPVISPLGLQRESGGKRVLRGDGANQLNLIQIKGKPSSELQPRLIQNHYQY